MISWKISFKEISKDLELTKKKKQALDDLLTEGKISQPTYESLNKELTDAITDIEARRKALSEKVTSKINELEQQITVLEMFLANSELEYAAGEIDEELHQRESNAFALGLEVTKQELNAVKETVTDLIPEEPITIPPAPPSEVAEEAQGEELVEEPPEIAVETPAEEPSVEEAGDIPQEEPPETAVETPADPETTSEEIPGEQLMQTPADEPFVEEVVEIPSEALPEAPPETPPEMPGEVPKEEEEELQPSEEIAEEAVEETSETSEVADETVVEEAPTEEEEATTQEEEYWQ